MLTKLLTLRKSLPKSAPKLPYRVFTEEEREEFWNYERNLPPELREIFWQQTKEGAREIIEIIGEGGFIIGGKFEWGCYPEGFGAHRHIYSRNYGGNKNTEKVCDHDNVIGKISLWEEGGFLSNPVSVWYQNPELINDAMELGDFLISLDISFGDSGDWEKLLKNLNPNL